MKKDLPFFSIIVPTYNREKRILTAVRSLLEQKFKEYEIIIVNDGSTDGTGEVLKEILRDNSCIRYFDKNNEERSIARNFGIAHALGKYIGFLDSDDVVYSNHLTVAYELLVGNKFPEVGHLGYEHVDGESGKVITQRNDFDGTFKQRLIHENILHGNAIFIRNDIAKKVNFIPNSAAVFSEDWYLWLRLASRYWFYFNNTITSSVIHHSERSLLNINPDKLVASTNIIVEYLKRDEQFLLAYKDKVSYHFANHFTFLALILSLTKNRRLDTLKYLFIAMKHDPCVIFRRRFLASIKYLF